MGAAERLRLKRRAWDHAVAAYTDGWQPRRRTFSCSIGSAMKHTNLAIGYDFSYSFYTKARLAALAQVQGQPLIRMPGPVGHPQRFPDEAFLGRATRRTV